MSTTSSVRYMPADDGSRHPVEKVYWIDGFRATYEQYQQYRHARAMHYAAAAPLATHWALNSFYN